MLKIGLTGGIGCGKTTVANLFAGLGVPIIDADFIARQLVAPEKPALALLSAIWGRSILKADGSLDRAALRNLIFASSDAKQRLEAIMHPLIFEEIQRESAKLQARYCLIAIPLLFETQMQASVDRVLVVDCPTEIQVQRVSQRDGLPLAQIRAIIASQVPREFRIAHADDLITNVGDDDKLAEEVKKLHNLYLSISDCQD